MVEYNLCLVQSNTVYTPNEASHEPDEYFL